jgi:hypothetical protein
MNRLFSDRIGHIGAVMGASAPIVSTALPILFIKDIESQFRIRPPFNSSSGAHHEQGSSEGSC